MKDYKIIVGLLFDLDFLAIRIVIILLGGPREAAEKSLVHSLIDHAAV